MSSLHQLLSEEGFKVEQFAKNQKKVKFRDRAAAEESITLPIYICHDRKSFDFSKSKSDKAFSRDGSSVLSANSQSTAHEKVGRRSSDGPAIDQVAIKAVISILSGYIGQYLRDDKFRETMREKCYTCFIRNTKVSDNGVFANMELGIESIEKLVENPGTKSELKMKSLRNSIRLLTLVASLNSKGSKNGSTSGTPNAHLSACAQLYLSIVYKLEKNDRISARHLLQAFCDSPYLARTHLLPELWEHLFLPHLLHIKIWYGKEFDFLQNSDSGDGDKKMKALTKAYNEQMDMGTSKFAFYYKQWLKTGAQAPPLPSVPLPSKSSYRHSRRQSADSFVSISSINKSLYRAVFGSTLEGGSMDLDGNGVGMNSWDLEEEENVYLDEDSDKQYSYQEVGRQSTTLVHRRSSSLRYRKQKAELWPVTVRQKPDYLRFLTCQNEPAECIVHSTPTGTNGSTKKVVDSKISHSSDLSKAITTICSSSSLRDCEMAIHVMTKAWLNSRGDPMVEIELSKTAIIEGMLEVLFASNDDEVLELAISILAEFVTRKEVNQKIILNSDPQLDIFIRMLRSTSLFLKSAALLYLVKPMAKQMISMEWVPLVLRVLEFGDQLQTLFTVQCSPQLAAYYLLDQLLTGFDEDKNWENARQVVSLGGLSLLARRMKMGDISEKSKAASVIYCCIQADGRCRHYLANNLKKESVIALLVLGEETDHQGHAFSLLTELLCLHRRTQRTKFLNGLLSGWGSMNTMHILLVYLQRARPEERAMVAVMLLQLDLMGDPLKCSVYREEVVEAIIAALDCQACNEKVQEESARALLILGGHFSYTGQTATEKWLLKEAGFDESSGDSFHGRDIVVDEFLDTNEEDEDAIVNWQRRAAVVLLTSGHKKLVSALSNCIANGIPSLARASLVTVSWMSSFLHSVGDDNLQSVACSILIPQLKESLNFDKAVEERVLASFSLLRLAKSSESIWIPSSSDKEVMARLWNLSQVTWTANELISIITSTGSSSSRHNHLPYPDLHRLPS